MTIDEAKMAELLEKYKDKTQEELLEELAIHMVTTNPEGVKKILVEQGHDPDVIDSLRKDLRDALED